MSAWPVANRREPRSETRSSPTVPPRQRPDHPRQRRRVWSALHRHADLRPDRNGDRSGSPWRGRLADRRAHRLHVSRMGRHLHRHERWRLTFARQSPPPAIQQARASTPASRAISDATAPGSLIAATSRALSSALQRRRRSTDVMTSIRFIATWLTSGYPRVLRRCPPVTRRRLPDAYLRCYGCYGPCNPLTAAPESLNLRIPGIGWAPV